MSGKFNYRWARVMSTSCTKLHGGEVSNPAFNSGGPEFKV